MMINNLISIKEKAQLLWKKKCFPWLFTLIIKHLGVFFPLPSIFTPCLLAWWLKLRLSRETPFSSQLRWWSSQPPRLWFGKLERAFQSCKWLIRMIKKQKLIVLFCVCLISSHQRWKRYLLGATTQTASTQGEIDAWEIEYERAYLYTVQHTICSCFKRKKSDTLCKISQRPLCIMMWD